jgi:EAL domain-containing protein (putative c-di-GMP-specific phosphodiesterase class I)
MSTLAMERLQIANRLRRGIEQDELCLFYQPRINISTGEVVGLEALLRWQHPDLGIILPGEFISLAEESGLNYAIGDWVLQEVCN